jgi:hypothetical protein
MVDAGEDIACVERGLIDVMTVQKEHSAFAGKFAIKRHAIFKHRNPLCVALRV